MDGLDASIVFFMIWGWKSCQNCMLGCAENIQKNVVFVIFHFLIFFHDCCVSGGVLGPHFGAFGDTWAITLVILEGPGEVLKFQ